MPAGPAPLGLVAFGAVKFVGYTMAGAYLRSIMPESNSPPWLVGGARTLLAGFGTVWSCILDVPAVLAVFVIPGGMWIC
jgi:hypothetical protein